MLLGSIMLGSINHVAITAGDLGPALDFYRPVLDFLGYLNTKSYPELSIWESASTGTAVHLWQARAPTTREHDRYSPGLHHLAFDADSRQQVDEFHGLLLEIGAKVLDPPAEYDYEPGYYAVFCADPDGIKLELAHIPE